MAEDKEKSKISMIDRFKKASTIKEASVLSRSMFFNEVDMVQTEVPMINVALSGRLDGGIAPGLTMWAGPSKHFKAMFSLLMAAAYMKKYPEAVMLFYDSEFGTPKKYFETFNIDPSRVLHSPLLDIEQLKSDIMVQLREINRGDKVIILIDSIGNLASKKEVEDALNEKSAADFTRAKQIKSLFRMVTPHLSLKDIPMVVVNHTYKTMELYSKDIVGGGTGSYYSSNNIFIVGRQQEKDGKDTIGFNFIINVEKSRYVKEKSKIPITVSFEGGIQKYSGLMDIALAGGFVDKPSQGWYSIVDRVTGELGDKKRLSDTLNAGFWEPILNNDEFKSYVRSCYEITHGCILENVEEDV
jgi:RecA/RadA recombinase